MYLRKSVWAALFVFVAAVSGVTTWQLLHVVRADEGALIFLPILHFGLFFWALGTLLAWGGQALFHSSTVRLGAAMREGLFVALLVMLVVILKLSGLLNWFFVLGFGLIFALLDIFFWSGLLSFSSEPPAPKKAVPTKKTTKTAAKR